MSSAIDKYKPRQPQLSKQTSIFFGTLAKWLARPFIKFGPHPLQTPGQAVARYRADIIVHNTYLTKPEEALAHLEQDSGLSVIQDMPALQLYTAVKAAILNSGEKSDKALQRIFSHPSLDLEQREAVCDAVCEALPYLAYRGELLRTARIISYITEETASLLVAISKIPYSSESGKYLIVRIGQSLLETNRPAEYFSLYKALQKNSYTLEIITLAATQGAFKLLEEHGVDAFFHFCDQAKEQVGVGFYHQLLQASLTGLQNTTIPAHEKVKLYKALLDRPELAERFTPSQVCEIVRGAVFLRQMDLAQSYCNLFPEYDERYQTAYQALWESQGEFLVHHRQLNAFIAAVQKNVESKEHLIQGAKKALDQSNDIKILLAYMKAIKDQPDLLATASPQTFGKAIDHYIQQLSDGPDIRTKREYCVAAYELISFAPMRRDLYDHLISKKDNYQNSLEYYYTSQNFVAVALLEQVFSDFPELKFRLQDHPQIGERPHSVLEGLIKDGFYLEAVSVLNKNTYAGLAVANYKQPYFLIEYARDKKWITEIARQTRLHLHSSDECRKAYELLKALVDNSSQPIYKRTFDLGVREAEEILQARTPTDPIPAALVVPQAAQARVHGPVTASPLDPQNPAPVSEGDKRGQPQRADTAPVRDIKL